ncbi:hypothetical protein PV396_04905 [Streptomyces sp. ME02-8801-2C]|uniref:hypothetical protein n=1 Tax=Streptomyces sp. ME02-8801-2C TaxID=3028680 RepID=UPI0029B6A40D|nr:hypothetical protein [Streptomyces sp. ME02-8801-2C]MDX3451292.1 hypothetical protein [Streptomyces sp. ME02-8801-2C]
MAVEQLPGQVREFARYLNGLLARLDQGAGWCGVFWERDPDGMRACLEGREVPPWDVVEALLHDLAAGYATDAVTSETEQARVLHQASLAEFDSRLGARDTLGDRLDVMLREQKYAADRLAELGRLLASATTHEEAEGLRLDLAWARDDHERASARCVELRYRLDQLARRVVSRAPLPHRDGDEEADLFAGGVRNAPHPTDPLTLPRQRTETDQRTTADSEDAGAGRRRTGRAADREGPGSAVHGGDRASGRAGEHEGAGWRDGSGSGYLDDRGAGDPGLRRQYSDDEASGGRDGSRDPGRVDERAGAGQAAHGGERAFGRPGSGDEAPLWRADTRGVAQETSAGASDWREGARRADDLGGGRPAAYVGHHDVGDGASGRRDDARRADDRDGPLPDSTGSEEPGESPVPQLPADWYAAPAVEPEPEPEPAPKQRSKRRARGSARFAGAMDDADTGGTPVGDPTPGASGRRTPRGARFAGAGAKSAVPVREPLDDDARHDTIDAVRNLVRLRSEGRSGEAHALLVEASHWPAARFPLLAAELHRAGLGADWATLLWEAASLPVDRLVAAADALVAAGRGTDGEQILRQGMARPAQEVGEAVLRLAEDGRKREVRALLDAYVRVRTPEEAARSVATDPQRLVPLLLEAAKGASEDRYWDLLHALRVAGHSA